MQTDISFGTHSCLNNTLPCTATRLRSTCATLRKITTSTQIAASRPCTSCAILLMGMPPPDAGPLPTKDTSWSPEAVNTADSHCFTYFKYVGWRDKTEVIPNKSSEPARSTSYVLNSTSRGGLYGATGRSSALNPFQHLHSQHQDFSVPISWSYCVIGLSSPTPHLFRDGNASAG